MLELILKEQEFYDSDNNEFIYIKPQTIKLEHSLVSISKWESKWNKPFLDSKEKTKEETIDYIRCMNITQNVNPLLFLSLDNDDIKKVSDYIESPMTATWFSNETSRPQARKEIVTSELIYYWMIAYSIPMECQRWHLNRLLTLIKICNIKNSQDSKKMNKASVMKNNTALNNARRAKYSTKG